MADEATEQELRKNLQVIQSMIDASAERLDGLRTQCATSAELTQQEIRTLEVSSYFRKCSPKLTINKSIKFRA